MSTEMIMKAKTRQAATVAKRIAAVTAKSQRIGMNSLGSIRLIPAQAA